MKYQMTLDQIRAGRLSSADLQTLRERAVQRVAEGDADSRAIVQALDSAVAKDSGIVFMGFCPSGNLANRLDSHWKQQGICTFDYDESVDQMNLFRSICTGDLIVLKKSEEFGRTMSLHGHGRVTSAEMGPDGRWLLRVDWSSAVQFDGLVPMMGCQSTVNLRAMETVEGALPAGFFDWAGLPRRRA